ncbi:MAG: D-aminoacyl-tRNA deacylase [Candidatus Micrarchaeota archaeon]
MLILFTERDIASKNIAEHLMKLGFERKGEFWHYGKVRMMKTDVESVLDMPTGFETDLILVLSPHKSKAETKMLTCHVPGNWDKADFRGENRILNTVYASKIKIMVNTMKKLAAEKLPDFEVAMEVDHHGPTCKVPILFVEIGSNEEAWQNTVAGEIVAHAVIEAIENNAEWPVAFGVGGDHYAKPFRKIIFEPDNVAIGHIIPKYHLKSLAEDTFKQAIEKSVEKVTKVIVVKDDLNVEQKKKVRELCEKFGLNYEET